jgi:hypothetical protein
MVQINDTSRTREDVYVDNDNQIQSNEEIGDQEPMPCGIEELELSWDRNKGFMRIIIKDQGTWYFKELMGKAQLLSADSAKGRLHIRAIPFLDGDTLYLARDPESVAHEPLEEGDIAESLQRTNNRLCYNRQETCWRIRDERKPWMDDSSRRLVADYVGDISIEWNRNDIVAHIFHKGEIFLDKDNVAHLYDSELQHE